MNHLHPSGMNYPFLGTDDTGELEGLTPMENEVLRRFKNVDAPSKNVSGKH